MEIIGKQSTKSKSYSTQRQEINEIICYAAARNKRRHMIPSVKKSTKSLERCLASMTLSLHAEGYQSSFRFRRKTKSIHFPVKYAYKLRVLLLQSDVETRALLHL